MRIYNYIFFKICQILGFFDDSPVFAAVIVMCWLFMFNSFTLIDYVLHNFEIPVLRNMYMDITTGILIFGGHLLYFYSKKRHVKINEAFKNESKPLSVFGSIGVILYIFLTVWIFFKYTVPFVGGRY